ncbi:hypothetical protein Lbir_2407 [Legionella birminghamensis]|uniref:Coiled-coil protein n=1 Tax=Legionella birminghamensis TaxID=28083 RepID=A0A378IM57_9GAMM|nr:hypothetical protein [Legionella birminghamensis]KTC68874.1 hypothetical protein Lbir_2407 [Legionella birminghamensis]STX33184.1 Uncharacterised protein [Legionella birminghamensis]
MTMYLEIVRFHIKKEILNYTGKSVANENSWWNAAAAVATSVTGIEMGIDSELSGAKRDIGSIIIEDLKKITLEKAAVAVKKTSDDEEDVEADKSSDKKEVPLAKTDTELHNEVNAILTRNQATSSIKADEKHKEDGTFESKIDLCIKLANKLNERFAKAGLANISFSLHPVTGALQTDDPLDIFRYWMAQYIYKNVSEEVYGRKSWGFWGNPKELADEKESLIKRILITLTDDLDTLDKHHPRYLEKRRERVLEYIKQLSEGNLKAIDERSTNVSAPCTINVLASFSIELGKLRPAEGYLKHCLDQAQTIITEPKHAALPTLS